MVKMGSTTCMNASCGTTTTLEWKKGWPLRSGGFADLCYRCGSAYESYFFCETFHLEQSGWRECYICCKRLHCGCIASKFLVEFLDFGGVSCAICASRYQPKMTKKSESDGFDPVAIRTHIDKQATNGASRTFGNDTDGGRLSQLCQIMEDSEPHRFSQPHRGDTRAPLGEEKQEEVIPNFGLATFFKPESVKSTLEVRDMQESLSQPSLSMNLGVNPSGPPFSGGSAEGKERNKASPSQKVQRVFPILPKLSASSVASPCKSVASQMRIARPPVEGRGKNHLLPRYWPRITDQELQQIAGDLNSKVVPLFEKVLSASDAGRIGRLVLPKACAEAYFPSINQSEGVPLRVQDVKGKEWIFQFRFWPNNNSRMYVLEGVTPCIQSMQLQAGDTVTFSRIDPGGKLMMGFRKATNHGERKSLQASNLPNGVSAGETSSPALTKNPPTINGSLGPFQMLKGEKDSYVNGLSENLDSADGDIGLLKNETNGGRTSEDSPRIKEKKRTRNIAFKSKRMLMHNEKAMELRFTWKEAQDLLRPPPSAKPTIVTIEDHEFEEYNEPPVFGKRTVFTSWFSGKQEQWAQCDDCSKWRRLPVDVLLPSKWTCSENVWDTNRCLCSVAEEMRPKGFENLLRIGTGSDSKNKRITETKKSGPDHEPCGLDALARAAVLGDSLVDSSAGATTRHPRHRPGCTCIVCIQPPSGKGKHKPACSCKVCNTVNRRFKTLMLRKKRRQLEREAEDAQKDQNAPRNDLETDCMDNKIQLDNEGSHNRVQSDLAKTSTARIDLNFHPCREETQQVDDDGNSVMSLSVVSASLPKANGKGQAANQTRDEGLIVSVEREAEKSNKQRRDASSDTGVW